MSLIFLRKIIKLKYKYWLHISLNVNLIILLPLNLNVVYEKLNLYPENNWISSKIHYFNLKCNISIDFLGNNKFEWNIVSGFWCSLLIINSCKLKYFNTINSKTRFNHKWKW